MVTDLDITKWNTYQLRASHQSGGSYELRVENPNTQEFESLHFVPLGNISEVPARGRMRFQAGLVGFVSGGGEASGNRRNFELNLGAFQVSTYGAVNEDTASTRYAFQSTKTISPGVETNIVVLKNRVTINDMATFAQLRLERLSAASDGTKIVEIRVYTLDPALDVTNVFVGDGTASDFPDWQYVDAEHSIAATDINSVARMGGDLLFSFAIGKVDSTILSFTDTKIVAGSLQEIVITATSSGASDVSVGLSWLEDL
jgi:hypothetical protein